MHIAEGVLSAPVLIGGAAAAAAGIAVGLKRLDESRLMTAGLVGAAFIPANRKAIVSTRGRNEKWGGGKCQKDSCQSPLTKRSVFVDCRRP